MNIVTKLWKSYDRAKSYYCWNINNINPIKSVELMRCWISLGNFFQSRSIHDLINVGNIE